MEGESQVGIFREKGAKNEGSPFFLYDRIASFKAIIFLASQTIAVNLCGLADHRTNVTFAYFNAISKDHFFFFKFLKEEEE